MNFNNYLKGIIIIIIIIDADLIKNPNYIFFQKLPKNPLKSYWEDLEKKSNWSFIFTYSFYFLSVYFS
jgi:hypothetical protein